jgi:hypothetical protein
MIRPYYTNLEIKKIGLEIINNVPHVIIISKNKRLNCSELSRCSV